MTPEERRAAWGSVGGMLVRSRYDPLAYTSAAREAAEARFARLVDPDGRLPDGEREARARALKGAHFRALALKSAEVRGRPKRKAARASGEPLAAGPEVGRGTQPRTG